MQKQTLGQKIAELRKEKGMTQLELANQLNITDKAVSKWERDISCPDINTFPKIAEILGVSVDELLKSSKAADNENEKSKEIVDTVLKAIPLAMGVAVTVLMFLDSMQIVETSSMGNNAIPLLGIAVIALSIRAFREK